MDLQSVFAEVNSWPVEDRLRLMDRIWDGLVDQDYPPVVTDEMKADLDRRCDELDRAPDAVVSWEAVEARALKRFGE